MRLNSRKTSNQEKSGGFVKYQNWWGKAKLFQYKSTKISISIYESTAEIYRVGVCYRRRPTHIDIISS